MFNNTLFQAAISPCLNGGHWMVQRADLITEIVKDPEHFSAREMQIPRVPNPPFYIPLSVDPPANIPYRRALMPRFTPAAIARLEPRIRYWAESIVDEVKDRGRCDFVSDVSARFPVSVFMELMVLPIDRLVEFRSLANDFFNARTPEQFAELSGRIFGIFTALADERRRNPTDDLTTWLVTVDMEGRNLSQDEVLAISFVMFLGGMDTVTNVTAFTFRYLATDPELQHRLVMDHALIPAFAAEGLRMFGVINTPRLCVKDTDRHGVSFRAGEMVLSILSQTGRDARLHVDPDRFDIGRGDMGNLNFSTGPHLCIGHVLARVEMRILAEVWMQQIPRFRRVAGAPNGFRIGTVNEIHSLPIEWDVSA